MKSGQGFLANDPTTILLGSKVSPVAAALMNVTPENVLDARAAVLREAESLSRYLTDRAFRNDEILGLCGGDPISSDARDLFKVKIREAAVAPLQLYVQRLQDVAEQLAATALEYGVSEVSIERSFAFDSARELTR